MLLYICRVIAQNLSIPGSLWWLETPLGLLCFAPELFPRKASSSSLPSLNPPLNPPNADLLGCLACPSSQMCSCSFFVITLGISASSTAVYVFLWELSWQGADPTGCPPMAACLHQVTMSIKQPIRGVRLCCKINPISFPYQRMFLRPTADRNTFCSNGSPRNKKPVIQCQAKMLKENCYSLMEQMCPSSPLLKQRISWPSHPSTSTSTAQRTDHKIITGALLKHVLVYHLSGDFLLFIPIVLSNFHWINRLHVFLQLMFHSNK